MSYLFGPLRRRRVWATFFVVLILGLPAVAFGPSGFADASLLASGLRVLSFAAFASAAVLLLSGSGSGFREESMEGVGAIRRRRVHRAVVRGDLTGLSARDQVLGEDYADAYVTDGPQSASFVLLSAVGLLSLGSALFLGGAEGWTGGLAAIQTFLGVLLAAVLLPLQIRWLRLATRVSTWRGQ